MSCLGSFLTERRHRSAFSLCQGDSEAGQKERDIMPITVPNRRRSTPATQEYDNPILRFS